MEGLNFPVHFHYDMLKAWVFSWQVAQARDGFYEEGGSHWDVHVWCCVSCGHCFHQHPGAFWCHQRQKFLVNSELPLRHRLSGLVTWWIWHLKWRAYHPTVSLTVFSWTLIDVVTASSDFHIYILRERERVVKFCSWRPSSWASPINLTELVTQMKSIFDKSFVFVSLRIFSWKEPCKILFLTSIFLSTAHQLNTVGNWNEDHIWLLHCICTYLKKTQWKRSLVKFCFRCPPLLTINLVPTAC